MFVQSQPRTQNGLLARTDMSNQLLNRLDDMNVPDKEAGTNEGDNATYAGDEAHMMDVADDNGESNMTEVANRRAGMSYPMGRCL